MHEPLTIQRIVDGEYRPDELRVWVDQADASSERWRELALAFLENQAWSDSFRSRAIAGTEITERITEHLSNGGDSNPSNEPAPLVGPPTAPNQSLARPTRWSLSGGWGVLASAAAVALILFALNAWPGNNDPGESGRVSNVATQPADQPPALNRADSSPQPVHDPTSLVAYRPDYRMKLLDDQGQPAGSDIPLFTEQSARKIGYTVAPTPIPDELRQQWARSGYRVQQDVDYLTGKLDGSRQFVVPVRTTSVAIGQ